MIIKTYSQLFTNQKTLQKIQLLNLDWTLNTFSDMNS